MSFITGQVLETLRQFDTPTICNVIELFDARSYTAGYMDGRVEAVFPDLPPMVGFASTVTCRTAVQPRQDNAYTRLPDQIARFDELPGAPVVVFQDLDGAAAAATFGEIMCTAYKTFGAVGLVTNGPGRDIEQVRALDFPVFTGSTVCSHGYIQILDVHVAVHVGGIAVYPGDLLHGDGNGVTTIPPEIAADVADVAGEFVAAEQMILDTLHGEGVTLAQLREAAAEKDALVRHLRERIRASG